MEEAENKEEIDPSGTEDKDQEKKHSKVRKISILLMSLILLLWSYYIISDRLVPYTNLGTVKAYVIPITPRVSGHITRSYVGLHEIVQPGDTLFQLDPRPFELAIRKAEAAIDQAGLVLNTNAAGVKAAAARLGVARANMEQAERNYNRVKAILEKNPNAISESQVDQIEVSYIRAQEEITSAEAEIYRAVQQLGPEGRDNPKLKLAYYDLEQAHLNLSYSTIVASNMGVIESYNVEDGFFVAPGQAIATLLPNTNIWVEADMKENNLSRMKIGQEVELSFDLQPGKIFKGRVRSIGYAAQTDKINRGGLPEVKNKSGWLRDPQRFPVIVEINKRELEGKLRVGAQVDVVVFATDNSLMKALAKLRIRINSLFSILR